MLKYFFIKTSDNLTYQLPDFNLRFECEKRVFNNRKSLKAPDENTQEEETSFYYYCE